MNKKNFFVSMLLLALVVVPAAVFAAADKKPPIIYVYGPSGGAEIRGSSVRVYGMATDSGTGVKIVSVNGAPANSGTGKAVKYSKVIYLPQVGVTYGIKIVALDFAGNRAEKRLTVTRVK